MSWCPYKYSEEELAAIREAKMDMEQELWSKVERAENGERVPYWWPPLFPMTGRQAANMDDGSPQHYGWWSASPLAKAEKAIQTAVAEQIGMQTAQHLCALDEALGKAVEAVERTGGWVLKKSNGGSHVYNQRGGRSYFLPDDVAEMLHAFVSGDLLTALQMRADLHEALPVAP